MQNDITTYTDIFAAYDAADLAIWLGVTRQHLRVLKNRRRIPSDYWDDLRDGAARAGKPLPDGALERAEIHFCRLREESRREPELDLKGARP